MAVDLNPKLWGSIGVVENGDLDAVSTLPNGGYVVASRWNGRISFKVYDGNGDLVTTHLVAVPSGTNLSQWQPHILTNTDGSFVITWTEAPGAASGGRVLRSQAFDINGQAITVEGESQGAAETLSQAANADGVHVATNGHEGRMIAYVKEQTSGVPKLTLLEITKTGQQIETVLNIDAASTKVSLDWLGDAVGYAVSFNVGNDLRIITVKNGVFTLYPTAIPGIAESDLVALKDANGNPTGKFVVTYVDQTNYQVTVDTFHLDGTGAIVLDSSVPLAPRTTDSGGLKTSIAALHDGGYAVAYKGHEPATTNWAEIYVKVFDAEGHEGPAIRIPVNGHQNTPAISEMADGRLSVSWHDPSTGVGAIETVIVDARAAAVTVVGTTGYDVYAPSKHTGDNLDGGDGIDTLTFRGAGAGVVVNLLAESGSAGDAAGDTYKNFENIIGSSFNDSLTGNAASNVIQAGAGNDILNGYLGADRMEGGAGNDLYYVDSAWDAVVETASGGTADLVYASSSYTLAANVEKLTGIGSSAINLTGNGLHNTITGNVAANTLKSSTGNDTLNGGKGNDVLWGGTGADKFVFNTAPNLWSNKDKIMDWVAKDDTIYLENGIFTRLKVGGLANSSFRLGSKALDGDDFVGYNKVTGDLWYDANGSKAGGQVVFANIGKNKAIFYNDFLVI